MIQTAQNTLLLPMLKENPQDVHAIRKNLERFPLPGDNHGGPINFVDIIPNKTGNKCGDVKNPIVGSLSLVLSRS